MDHKDRQDARETRKRERAEARSAREDARSVRKQARAAAQESKGALAERRSRARVKSADEKRSAAAAGRGPDARLANESSVGAEDGELLYYAVIDRMAAPPQPPAPRGRLAKAITAMMDSLGPGLVARIEPQAGDRPRKIENSLYRMAGRIGKPVTTWEDQGFIYVELLDVQAEAEAAIAGEDAEPRPDDAIETATAEAVDEEIVEGALVEDEVLEGELVDNDAAEDGPHDGER